MAPVVSVHFCTILIRNFYILLHFHEMNIEEEEDALFP